MTPAEFSSTDVFVIGGGPAGSTVSTLLARDGFRVVMAEKERHPRFHIGESLLPMNLPILERLGVAEQVAAIGVRKAGADFTLPDGDGGYRTFHFDRALGDSPGHAWEVRREDFDALLFRHARDHGVEAFEHCEVVDVAQEPDGSHRVTTRDADGETRRWRTRFLVDASGRDTLMARRRGWKRRNPAHSSAAIFGHFRGVRRRPGDEQGNISIYWFEHGWVWMIPLRDGLMSVGAVCWPEYLRQRGGRPVSEFLAETIALCPHAASRMADASSANEVRVTGNYSYTSRRMTAPGLVLVGDAFAFIDPVFSSGVYLAMNSAEQAVPLARQWLAGEHAAYQRSCRRYERRIRRGLGSFSWFIYRFTSPAMRQLFAHPRNTWQVEQAVISMLAGDVFRRGPVTARLALFRWIYRLVAAGRWPSSWRAWRQRTRSATHEFA